MLLTLQNVLTGIIMEPGKTYSTVVENTFHLSMATLDVASVKKGMYESKIHFRYLKYYVFCEMFN